MLVDNSFSDFINLDLFNSTNSSSSSSSSSPKSPPQQHNFPLLTQDSSDLSFFNFNIEDDFSKFDQPTTTMAPYDFLGAFSSGSSPESIVSPATPPTILAIDPQLVGTPSTNKAPSDFGDDEDRAGDDDDEEDEPSVLPVAPVKAAGHGKPRRGTVQSGGVVKKSTAASAKDKENSSGARDGATVTFDDGKPPDYQKLSSKEKRQLRNKISARNFRVRRKEYITTLEGDVAERDRLIDAIRTELGSSRSENVALRQEVAALKKALLDGRGISETPVLPPPGPIPVRAATPSQQTVSVPITSANLVAPNPHKDLPNSPRLGARGFWGGTGVGLGGLGGTTPVHTAIIPEWSVLGALVGKPVSASSPSLQENINPALNGNLLGGANGLGGAGFDSFAEVNPFTLKALDAYRMQLWGRMAAQQHANNQNQNQQQQQQQPQQQQQLSGLAGSLRPHYFTSTRFSPGSLISGKAGANSYPSPPASPKLSLSSSSQPSKEQQQHAMYAAMASQTLLKKLGSAFWEAFSGSSVPSGSSSSSAGAAAAASAMVANGTRGWDAEKVRKVLEGKAVVKVVDVEPSFVKSGVVGEGTTTTTTTGVDAGAGATAGAGARACSCALTDILEESMRSLSLGKKV